MKNKAKDTKKQYLQEGADKRRGKMHNSERKKKTLHMRQASIRE